MHFLKHLAIACLYTYIALLFFVGFWPFNFAQTNMVTLDMTNGLQLITPATVYTQTPPEKLLNMKEFTIFLSLSSDYLGADGYARILTHSLDEDRMNFMVGQWKDSLVFKVKVDNKTMPVHFETEGILNKNEKASILIVFNGNELISYKDGEIKGRMKTGLIKFSHWNGSYPLVIGSEADGMYTWQGTIYSVAVFDRALSPNDMETLPSHITNLSPVIWYDFQRKDENVAGYRLQVNGLEKQNKALNWLTNKTNETNKTNQTAVNPPLNYSPTQHAVVTDLGRGMPADLIIPYYFKPYKKPVLEKVYVRWEEYRKNLLDIVINIAGFIPLGFLLSMYLTQKGLTFSKALMLSIVAGFVISLTIELLQYFLPTRTSSMPDLIANTMGTALGTLLRVKNVEWFIG